MNELKRKFQLGDIVTIDGVEGVYKIVGFPSAEDLGMMARINNKYMWYRLECTDISSKKVSTNEESLTKITNYNKYWAELNK